MIWLITFFSIWCFTAPAYSDEIRPALLDVKEQSTGLFNVTWKVPMRGDNVLKLTPYLPEVMEQFGTSRIKQVAGAIIQYTTYKITGASLTGQTFFIDGLSTVQTDVLLLIQLQDGIQHSAILRPGSAKFTVPLESSKLQVAEDYWQMGTIHILEGFDHLLFVFSLLLIVSGFKRLVIAISAFTIAHSITLVLASLNILSMPAAPTEAIIALSIVFLATEIIQKYRGQYSRVEKYPWGISFAFGLFHGLGFAGALAEIGVPQHELPLALLMFNIGVETGQLLFIIIVLSIITMMKRLPFSLSTSNKLIVPYAIGSIAAFWTINRVVSFLPNMLW